jgi:hypothetical protein
MNIPVLSYIPQAFFVLASSMFFHRPAQEFSAAASSLSASEVVGAESREY